MNRAPTSGFLGSLGMTRFLALYGPAEFPLAFFSGVFYTCRVLGRGAEAMSSPASGSDQLRSAGQKGPGCCTPPKSQR
jgi:hypothetical protein